MDYLSLFQKPTAVTIAGRSSSITNAFVSSIIPFVQPTADEVRQALGILCMAPDAVKCAYCGDDKTEWDHFRPLVKGKNPTGYISEIHNLVPACGKCNQSKGNKDWKDWMCSNAKLSPATRGVKDIAERIRRLEAYEEWGVPAKIDFETVVGKDDWSKHMENCKRVESLLRESQELAAKIKERVESAFNAR